MNKRGEAPKGPGSARIAPEPSRVVQAGYPPVPTPLERLGGGKNGPLRGNGSPGVRTSRQIYPQSSQPAPRRATEGQAPGRREAGRGYPRLVLPAVRPRLSGAVALSS